MIIGMRLDIWDEISFDIYIVTVKIYRGGYLIGYSYNSGKVHRMICLQDTYIHSNVLISPNSRRYPYIT